MSGQREHTRRSTRVRRASFAVGITCVLFAAPAGAVVVGRPVIGPLTLPGTGTPAEVGGRINPEGLATTYELTVECKGTESPPTCEPLNGAPHRAGTLPAGFKDYEVMLNVDVLKPGSYWFWIAASNAAGEAFWRVNFTIPAIPPGAAPEGTGPGTPYNPEVPSWIRESAQRAAERAVAEQREREARENAAKVAAPSVLRCHVPSLVGHTLRGARRLLARAHCALGHVKYPRDRRRGVRVVSQGPARGAQLQAGARVSVRVA